jgi:glycosyltransferase involved in cell wall biosynthesis
MRILYVQATFVPPPADQITDRFFLLSEKLEGDVLQPVWFSTPQEIEKVFGPGSYPTYTAGRFRYHWFLAARYHGIWQRLAIFRFYLRKGLELHRRQSFDCIVAYSHMTTGLMAGLLKLLTGTRLIIEIATSPKQVFLTDRPKPTLFDRLRHLYSDISLHLSMFLADRAHFLCPGQLNGYPLLRRVRNSVFHEFVTVAAIKRRPDSEEAEPFVLLVGAPWYLKGADLLVEAFLRLESDFPNVKLKLLGHYPDGDQLRKMIGASKRIEIFRAVPNPEALRMISKASILVLASRCEGMGRVLIEAMAAGVPLIGSNVGGIPYILRDGENGFVFPVGDSRALEARLRQLLADAELRRQMGERGYVRAHEELDERAYVREFSQMVEATTHGG